MAIKFPIETTQKLPQQLFDTFQVLFLFLSLLKIHFWLFFICYWNAVIDNLLSWNDPYLVIICRIYLLFRKFRITIYPYILEKNVNKIQMFLYRHMWMISHHTCFRSDNVGIKKVIIFVAMVNNFGCYGGKSDLGSSGSLPVRDKFFMNVQPLFICL